MFCFHGLLCWIDCRHIDFPVHVQQGQNTVPLFIHYDLIPDFGEDPFENLEIEPLFGDFRSLHILRVERAEPVGFPDGPVNPVEGIGLGQLDGLLRFALCPRYNLIVFRLGLVD